MDFVHLSAESREERSSRLRVIMHQALDLAVFSLTVCPGHKLGGQVWARVLLGFQSFLFPNTVSLGAL